MDEDQNSKRGQELFRKYQDGTASPEERAVVESWYLQEARQNPTVDSRELEHIRDSVWKQLKPVRKQQRTYIYAAAAICLAALAITIYFYRNNSIVNRKSTIVNQEILHGYNQATLTLADGTKINLDSAKAGIQIKDEEIIYNDGHSVIAEKGGSQSGPGKLIVNRISEIVNSGMLTLSTPKGGQYQVILEDGTKVWLNAASTLTYPSRFTGGNRIVELEGEAYFCVAKPANHSRTQAPFIVKSAGQEITVLGTTFNVTTFGYPHSTKTTLIDGSLQVAIKTSESSQGSTLPLLLKPGEQSIIQGPSIHKEAVDTLNEIAWKNGRFTFEKRPFRAIMDELSRWYNIEVIYQGGIPQNRLFGGMYRDKNFTSFIHILETTGIPFKVDYAKKTLTLKTK
ncbi:FecR family protein [bacterium A37T11]|nr:FecR family protein [bacterium A37T11]